MDLGYGAIRQDLQDFR